jgi:hypothetical protein
VSALLKALEGRPGSVAIAAVSGDDRSVKPITSYAARGIPVPRICLFATKRDYEHLVAAQDLFANLFFVADKYYPEESLPVMQGLLALPDLGFIMGKYQSSGPRYWVLRAKPNLRFRRLPDFDGRRRFEIDGNTCNLPRSIRSMVSSTSPSCLSALPSSVVFKYLLNCRPANQNRTW